MWPRAACWKRSKRTRSGASEEVGGVDAALGVGEEGAFEVDADGCLAARVVGWVDFDGVGEGFEGAEGAVDGGGDGGGEVVGDAFGGEEACELGEAAGEASMTSWPAAPWRWMSRKAGVRVSVLEASTAGSQSMERMRPSLMVMTAPR